MMPWGDICFVQACGDHVVLLKLAGSRMLRGKKVMCRGVFLLTKFKGEKQNVQVPSLPLRNFKELSSR
jgi:hypothetical protein